MRAHALRRGLWFLCLLLIAGAVGLAAWFVTDVKPALAAAPFAKDGKVPERWQKVDKAFVKRLSEASTDVLRPVVPLEKFKQTLGRTYKDRVHDHFLFTGPMPPEVKVIVTTEKPPEENAPKGLAVHGAVSWAIYSGDRPAEGTVVFQFTGAERLRFLRFGTPFGIKSGDDAKPYMFTKSKVIGPRHVEFTYTITDPAKPDDEPEIETIVWNGTKKADETSSSIIRVAKPKPIEGEGEAAAPGTGTQPAEATAQPAVAVPADQVAIADLAPTIKNLNARSVVVEFDENSSNYFRGRQAEKLVEQIKTSKRTLPTGEQGLEIVDTGDGPADKFNIKRGDVIISINGVPTPTREAILRVARTFSEQTTRVTIVLDRNGRKITYNVDPRDPKTRRAAAQAAERAGIR